MAHPIKSDSAWRALTPLAVLLALSACRPASDQPSSQTDADSETVSFKLTEAFRIGDESAGDSLLFGWVNDLAVDSKGQLYVTHDRLKRIRKFSQDGVLVGDIGREGEGPGEFIEMPNVHIGPMDSVYAWDSWVNRLTIFSPQEHAYVTSFTPSDSEDETFSPSSNFLGASSQGLLLQYSSGYNPESENTETRPLRIKLLGWNGAVLSDSVIQLSTDVLVRITETSIRFASLPYARSARFAFSNDQVLYFGTNDAIHVAAVPFGGGQESRFEISVPHTPIAVTQSERQEAITSYGEDFEEMIRARLPDFKPAFGTLIPDDEGRLWFELSQPESDQTRTWHIVERDGRVVGMATVPQRVRLRVVRNNRAYGIMTGEESGALMVVAWDVHS